MGNEGKSSGLVTAPLTWLESEWNKKAMAEGGDMKKGSCPLSAQAFLKLDAWCESTRGLNLKKGGKAKGKEKNSQWGDFPYSLLGYSLIPNIKT